MLKSRVITSIVLATLVFSALLLLPPLWLSVVLAGILLVAGGWESARLAGLSPALAQAGWIVALCAAGAGAIWLVHEPERVPQLFGFALLLWLVLPVWLMFPAFGRADADTFQPGKLVVVGLILVLAFSAIAWVHAFNPWAVIFLLLLIAAADIGAYFTGHRFGGPRLAPVISPGKTWSGAIGGVVLAVLVAAACAQLLPGIPFGPGTAALAAVGLVVLSVFGDLLISLFKRHRGLKDTSRLLPGHGGLLDRVDSLSAAAPAFALLVWANLS